MFSPSRDFFAAKINLVLQVWQNPNQPPDQPEPPTNGRALAASIASLSRRSGVSTAYIFHLREGRIHNPSFINLARIANAMGFDISWWAQDVAAGPPCISTTAS